MGILKTSMNTLRDGMSGVLFPNICIGCGDNVLKKGQHICSFCLQKRFELALTKDRMSSAGVILPHQVCLQQALWKFDKGGILQHLMHHLKYQQLTDAGTQLGAVFAKKIREHPQVQSILAGSEAVLLPVPLHYLKLRKRGFNQAFCIAQGIREILNIPICPKNTVARIRNTTSQTGLSLEKRQENVSNVFRVKNAHELSGKTTIIVDDVFTTGATSFELAKEIADAGTPSVMIWTIAQA